MRLDIRKEELEALRAEYPQGCRVELVKMDDPYRDMPPGLKGTVEGVDDTGSIHVHWDNGSHLGVVYGEDECRKVTEDREVTVEELLRRHLPSGKTFHFITPAGYVDLTGRDAEKILAGEMNPKGSPGDPECVMEMDARQLLEFRCKESDVLEEQGAVSAFVYCG